MVKPNTLMNLIANADVGDVPELNPEDQKFIEEGARILMKAEEIKQNERLFHLCSKEMEKQMGAMSRVMDTLSRDNGHSLVNIIRNGGQEE